MLGKVIFSQASVCPQGEGVSLTETETPWTETPLDRDPRIETSSLDRDPPYGKKRAVSILLECILVLLFFLFEQTSFVYLSKLLHMSHFAYACKTEGKNGISHLISALCINCLISIPEYSRLNHLDVHLVWTTSETLQN